ncbi:MAG: Capsule biosynthesis protein CapA [SAR116 cluster bacterium]|nr:MAG: Capsule biosynthesis protein CapA [SAR116 cluster bacterium]
MVADISALRDKVDVITVSHHWGVHFIPELIADYQFEVAHAAIDAGADVIFGNHPHMPKGIELYKGKPVFYGMNDFACAGAWQSPADQPGNRFPQSKDWDWTRHGKLLSERFGQVGHQDKSSTMIAKLLIEKGGVARVSVIPCFINDDLRPEPVTRADPRAQRICDEFQRISSSQGIDITLEWDGDEIILKGTDKLLP